MRVKNYPIKNVFRLIFVLYLEQFSLKLFLFKKQIIIIEIVKLFITNSL